MQHLSALHIICTVQLFTVGLCCYPAEPMEIVAPQASNGMPPERSRRLASLLGVQACKVLRGHNDCVNCLSYNHDGTQLASGSFDYTVRIWDPRNGDLPLQVLRGHRGLVRCLSYNHDSTQLASGSDDHTVRICDPRNGELLKVLRGHECGVWFLSYNHDNTQLTSESTDHTVRIWDSYNGELLMVLRGHNRLVNCLIYNHNGTQLASGSTDYTVRICDPRNGEPLKVLRGHEGSIWCLSYNHDGTQLASGSFDRTIRIWDLGSRTDPMFDALPDGIKERVQGHIVGVPADWECSICLGGVADDPIEITQCNHIFHQKCIARWRDQGGKDCPYCKQIMS